MDRTSKQEGYLKENGNKKDAYTQNQKTASSLMGLIKQGEGGKVKSQTLLFAAREKLWRAMITPHPEWKQLKIRK